MPTSWIWASLEQVSARVTVGYVGAMKGAYVGKGIPFLRSQNVRPNRFDSDGLVFIRREFHAKLAKSKLVPGDVVVVRSGVAVGTTCVIPETLKEANCADLVLIQRPLIQPHFISFYMNSAAQRHVDMGKVGVAQPHFNTASVASLSIPLPPVAEQTRIVREVNQRLVAADRLAIALDRQLERARASRQSLLREAFAGHLVPQLPDDEPASALFERIRTAKAQRVAEQKRARRGGRPASRKRSDSMQKELSPESLSLAWERTGRTIDARALFDEAGFGSDQVVQFYEALRATPEVHAAFQKAAPGSERRKKRSKHAKEEDERPKGSFRLVDLWLEDFKNLKDYAVHFNPAEGLDVVLGWNGTGKSNLFEALVIIFRDLHGWLEKDRWRPNAPMHGFRLTYEMDEHTVEVVWRPMQMKRPELKRGPIARKTNSEPRLERIKRDQLPLPRFVFGYYSGPTNRLAEHFLPMKQAHYERLRTGELDDAETLANLLEQRRFFCAETHHAKYILLAFCYKKDPEIARFLEDRLRIVSFESALFVIRKPRWHRNDNPQDFWGATGIMRRVMERLREFSIAPMVVEQTVTVGYNSTREDHYYFFLPDLQSLHAFADEYANARTFFLALESTDFSELIHDVKIQVRVKATATEQVPITFHQLSEGDPR